MGGMTRLLLLLWAGVTVATVVDLQKRIIGGHDCTDKERGYHVFLTMVKGPLVSHCSGSLISDEWILTAAHCWEQGETIKAVFGRNPNGNKVTITDPPEIFKDKHGKEHDIMLLKLPGPTQTPPPVGLPLPVDCKNKPKINDEVEIAGYYSSTLPNHYNDPKNVDTSKPLRCAKTKVVDPTASIKCLQNDPDYKYPHLLCYKDNAVDISEGDSGGGVVVNGTIYGVIVTSKKYACTGPASSMDICEDIYMNWIKPLLSPDPDSDV